MADAPTRRQRRAAGAARSRSWGGRARTRPIRRTSRTRPAPRPPAGRTRGPPLLRGERAGLEDRDLVEGLREHFLRVDLEVRVEDLLVHRAEVDGVAHVAAGVELREAGLLAVQAGLHRVADEEDRRRGAVVGARARVLAGSASELGPRRDEHAVAHAVTGEVLVEGR